MCLVGSDNFTCEKDFSAGSDFIDRLMSSPVRLMFCVLLASLLAIFVGIVMVFFKAKVYKALLKATGVFGHTFFGMWLVYNELLDNDTQLFQYSHPVAKLSDLFRDDYTLMALAAIVAALASLIWSIKRKYNPGAIIGNPIIFGGTVLLVLLAGREWLS